MQQLYAQQRLQFHGQLAPLAAPAPFQQRVRQATRQGWVVYSKRPFAGPGQVLAYLSRYTHRVGISHRRLLKLDRTADTLTFDYKDYADGARHKPMELSLPEFIRRLCLHFLPPRFVKIRPYGLLANRGRQARLERARALLGALPPPSGELPTLNPATAQEPTARLLCPHCGQPALILIRVVPPLRLTRRAAPTPTDTS